jgi:hypothetical protein
MLSRSPSQLMIYCEGFDRFHADYVTVPTVDINVPQIIALLRTNELLCYFLPRARYVAVCSVPVPFCCVRSGYRYNRWDDDVINLDMNTYFDSVE